MAASGYLSKSGLFFDELNKIRVLDPDVYQQAVELREDSKEFVDQIAEFQKLVDGFLDIINTIGNEVEKEKLKAIGSRNLLKSITKEREAKQQQLQALIMEKKLQLERLKVQYESLRKQEADQNELIEQFLVQK